MVERLLPRSRRDQAKGRRSFGHVDEGMVRFPISGDALHHSNVLVSLLKCKGLSKLRCWQRANRRVHFRDAYQTVLMGPNRYLNRCRRSLTRSRKPLSVK